MANKKTQNSLRKTVYGVLIVFSVGLLTYFFVIQPWQVHKQKQQFDKAEASLDALATKIEQTIGKPDETKKVKSCGYASTPYEQGQRSCDINVSLVYKNKNLDESNNMMAATGGLFNTKLYDYLGREDVNRFKSVETADSKQKFSQAINIYLLKKPCNIDYLYSKGLELLLTCAAPAKQEFFPVQE